MSFTELMTIIDTLIEDEGQERVLEAFDYVLQERDEDAPAEG